MIRVGQFVINSFWKKILYILELVELLISSVEQFIIRSKERRILMPILLKQILFTGVDGLRLIGILALVLGGMILFLAESLSQTILFNQNLIGTLMSDILLREIAPLFTAIILIGRSGTAVATEIGNMKVNNELEALESLGIDPLHFLVAPRVIGITVSMVLLVIYFFFIGMLGGYLFSTTFFNIQLPLDEYIGIVFQEMDMADIGMAMIKSLFFGIFISVIPCHKGLKMPPSITFVPVATTQSVVSSMTSVFFFYAYFTILFYL